MTENPLQDWGGSEGAKVPTISEANRHRRFEGGIQVVILLIFCVFIIILKIMDKVWGTDSLATLLPVSLPLFSFALGKADPGNG